jgi:diguanylate cyclase (GGDEF)-like protein
LLKLFSTLFIISCLITIASFKLAAFEKPIDYLSAEQPLTIAINQTSFPYHFVNKQGNADGLMIDLWRLWAQKQEVEIEFVAFPWLDTLSKVGNGAVDIHAGLSILDSRKQHLSFTKPLFPLYIHLYVNVALNEIEEIDDLQPYLIGVVEGSAHSEILAKKFPTLKQRVFVSRHELYKAALNKEVLIFSGLETISSNYPNYQQLKEMFPTHQRLHYQQGDFGVAVAKDNTPLLNFIEQGLAKISANERGKIERKWLGIDKSKNSLLIAFSPKFPPYSALSPTGNPQGLLIDFWRLWAKQTDNNVEFIARDIVDSLTLIEQQRIDVLLAFPKVWLNSDKHVSAPPFYKPHAKVYVSNRIKGVNSLHYFDVSEDSSGETSKGVVGILKKAPFKKALLEKFPKVNLRYFTTISAMLKASELGEIDAMISLVDTMNVRLIQDNLQTLFYLLDFPLFTIELSSLIDKNNPQLIAMVKEGFEQIALSELVHLEERWLSDEQSYYQSLLEKVNLNEREESFIKEDNEIKVGVLKSLAPISFFNEQGQFEGIDRDMLNLISLRTGLHFVYQSYDSWYQLYQGMLDGEIDMLTNVTPTETRRKQLLFSNSYWQTPWVILHPQNIGQQPKLTNFHGKQLAIIKGHYLIDFLRESHPLISLKMVDDRKDALIVLQQGQVDGVIESIASATQLLKQESLVSLTISVIEDMPISKSHFGLQPSKNLLTSIIDKGLASITAQEKSSIYEKWFTIDISTGLDKKVVLRVALQVAIIIFVILVIIIMWNRRLKAEITHRKQLEKRMKHMATHDELTGLANRVLLKDRINTAVEFHDRQSLMMAVLFLDLDGFKIVNDTYGHDVGDELLQQVATRLQSCVRKSDTVVRFGGDEFVLLLTGLHHVNEAKLVADKVLSLLQSPFDLSATDIQIGCSIGISVYPSDGTNDIDLLKEADTLMYKVKASGKNHYLTSAQFNEN